MTDIAPYASRRRQRVMNSVLTSRRSGIMGSSAELPVRFLPADHLLAVGVERIVDDPLCGVVLVIVLEAEMSKPLGDGFEARGFGLIPERVVGVGAVDDLREQHERRISIELVLLHECVERAFLA